MNSLLFSCALACLFLNPFSSIAQPGAIHSDPLHPLRMMYGMVDQGHAIQLIYTSPYGIKSLKDFSMAYSRPLPGGSVMAGVNAAGITGYLCYRGELAYSLTVGENFHAGLGLAADFLPAKGRKKTGIIPGSSFYLDYFLAGKFQTSIYFDSWTGLWTSREFPHSEARLSFASRFYPRDDISFVAGVSYARARKPVYSLGLSVTGGESHEIMGGMRSSPGGFWIAYRYSQGKFEFILSLFTGMVFGYEPGSAFRYHFK